MKIAELMRFCQERQFSLHGLILIWHREIQLWMQRRKVNSADLLSMMQQYLTKVVEHCAEKLPPCMPVT